MTFLESMIRLLIKEAINQANKAQDMGVKQKAIQLKARELELAEAKLRIEIEKLRSQMQNR